MTQAHKDKRDANIRRYLLVALAKFGLSGRQWDVLAIIMDNTYGWEDKERARVNGRGSRLDRNTFRYDDIAEEVGCRFDSVSRAMRELIAAHIVIKYSSPTKTSDGVFGINSDPESWVKKASNRSAKTATNNASLVGKNRDQSRNIGRQKPRPIQAKTATNVAEKPDNHAVFQGSNVVINVDPPIVPQRGTEISPVSNSEFPTRGNPDQIPTVEEALANPSMPESKALSFAERAYTKRFARPLTSRERISLQTYLQASPNRGALLAIWLTNLEESAAQRTEKRRSPEGKRWLPRSPFKDLLAAAADDFADRKARRENRRDPSERPCAA